MLLFAICCLPLSVVYAASSFGHQVEPMRKQAHVGVAELPHNIRSHASLHSPRLQHHGRQEAVSHPHQPAHDAVTIARRHQHQHAPNSGQRRQFVAPNFGQGPLPEQARRRPQRPISELLRQMITAPYSGPVPSSLQPLMRRHHRQQQPTAASPWQRAQSPRYKRSLPDARVTGEAGFFEMPSNFPDMSALGGFGDNFDAANSRDSDVELFQIQFPESNFDSRRDETAAALYEEATSTRPAMKKTTTRRQRRSVTRPRRQRREVDESSSGLQQFVPSTWQIGRTSSAGSSGVDAVEGRASRRYQRRRRQNVGADEHLSTSFVHHYQQHDTQHYQSPQGGQVHFQPHHPQQQQQNYQQQQQQYQQQHQPYFQFDFNQQQQQQQHQQLHQQQQHQQQQQQKQQEQYQQQQHQQPHQQQQHQQQQHQQQQQDRGYQLPLSPQPLNSEAFQPASFSEHFREPNYEPVENELHEHVYQNQVSDDLEYLPELSTDGYMVLQGGMFSDAADQLQASLSPPHYHDFGVPSYTAAHVAPESQVPALDNFRDFAEFAHGSQKSYHVVAGPGAVTSTTTNHRHNNIQQLLSAIDKTARHGERRLQRRGDTARLHEPRHEDNDPMIAMY